MPLRTGVVAATLALVVVVGCDRGTSSSREVSSGTSPPPAARGSQPFHAATLELVGQRGSGFSGDAKLWKAGNDRIRIVIEAGAKSGPRRAVHLHLRGCADDGTPVKEALSPLVAGTSETLIAGGVQGLVGAGRAIAIHETADPDSRHIACGDMRNAVWKG